MAEPPAERPGAFHPAIIVAPLALLAGGALVTHLGGAAAERSSHGGWINLSALSYAIAWLIYVPCAAGFVWMDLLFVRRLPGRTWPSLARMLGTTAGAAAAGIGVAVLGGGAVVFLGSQGAPGSQGLFYLLLFAIPVALLVGLVADVRIRLGARILR
jgi:hypothetical protein